MKKNLLLIFFVGLMLVACSRSEAPKSDKIIIVNEQAFHHRLFYAGVIHPIQTHVITAPAQGVLMDSKFQYGDQVKSGDLLFNISSTKFFADYKNALMQYIKAKSEFNANVAQLTEAKFLHQNLLISNDAFKMKESSYYTSKLALLQAKDVLQNLIRQLDMNGTHLFNLTISNVNKIADALHLPEKSERLQVFSPIGGVLLAAAKGDDESKKMSKGDAVKEGDVLAIIGDMSGVAVRVKINEMTINQLKINESVKITGTAFPDETLVGHITQIDRQGEGGANGMPTFSVLVEVPHLTQMQQNKIHVGMSAQVAIDLNEGKHMAVPFAALHEKQGQFYVERYDTGLQTIKEQLVQTGNTTEDTVQILAGLQKGDRIVLAG